MDGGACGADGGEDVEDFGRRRGGEFRENEVDVRVFVVDFRSERGTV